ncbi:hypothetical protein SBA4_6360001 [Candidatus Sulfopaludibacter sp. SbA4]|nr:hypothetical protein SBA4_6360001 [Candidatus Sulfopaludibacter sp. SbA4]
MIDPTTNRQFGQQYDANGNPAVNGAFPYDIENRLLPAQAPFSTYTYDHAGKRVFAAPVTPSTIGSTPCEIYFYGITGQRLATFSCTWSWSWIAGSNQQYVAPAFFYYQVKSWNVYFGSKLMRSSGKTIVTDRLGSVRANSGGERMQYFPYGEERTSTADGREKWGTYFRDGLGQDYADQRYYSPLSGSFWTPDPSGLAAVKYGKPLSWNRYVYGSGDPINRRDRTGLHVEDPDEIGGGSCQDAEGDWDYCDAVDGGGSSSTYQAACQEGWAPATNGSGDCDLTIYGWLGGGYQVLGTAGLLTAGFGDPSTYVEMLAASGAVGGLGAAAAAFAGGEAAAGLAESLQNAVPAIGRMPDLVGLAGNTMYNLFNPTGTSNVSTQNQAWINNLVNAGQSFSLQSTLTSPNMVNPDGTFTGLGDELGWLFRSGYELVGSYLVPPVH